VIEQLARLGYASKALVYAIVGVLAILAATDRGGAITDVSGALRVVRAKPLGELLLVVLAIGLCGYGAWRVLDAWRDPDRDGASAPGVITRIGNVVRGAIYGGLGLEAIRLLRGRRGARGDEAELWSARILQVPFGDVVLGLVAVIVAVYGGWEFIRVTRGGSPDPKLDWSPIPAGARGVLQYVSRFGVGIRGVLIAAFGLSLFLAALHHNPGRAAGSRESLLHLGTLFEGRWFLVVLAAGLLAYAVDQAVHARCRRIRPVL
jgi:hypothetical protein